MKWSGQAGKEENDVKDFVRRTSVMGSRKSIKESEPSKVLEGVMLDIPEREFAGLMK